MLKSLNRKESYPGVCRLCHDWQKQRKINNNQKPCSDPVCWDERRNGYWRQGFNLHPMDFKPDVYLVTPPALPESLCCEHHITPSWEGFPAFQWCSSLKDYWFHLQYTWLGTNTHWAPPPADATMDQAPAGLGFPTPDPTFYFPFGLSFSFRIQLAHSLALDICILLSHSTPLPARPGWVHIYRAQLCMGLLRARLG